MSVAAPVEAFDIAILFDIVILADFTRGGDSGFRIAQEIRSYADLGLSVGLVHLQVSQPGAAVSPDVQVCVRAGLAVVLPASPNVHARLAIVHSAVSLTKPVQNLSGMQADKVVLVHDRAPNRAQIGSWFSFQFGPVVWAPTNRWVRTRLMELDTPVPLLAEDWRPMARPLATRGTSFRKDGPAVFGRVSLQGESQWPKTIEEIKDIFPIRSEHEFRIMGRPPAKLWDQIKGKSGVLDFDPADMTVERFLASLDVFMYFSSIRVPSMPEAAIASMMASGKLVVLPTHLESHFGPGAIYADGSDAMTTVKELMADEDALRAAREAAVLHAGYQFPEAAHRARVLELLGSDMPAKPRKRRATRRKTALMVPSNGIGLGHATRLLAISRQLDKRIEPVFCTMAQAAPIIESFGYLAEYMPSQGDTHTDRAGWDAWFRYQLGELIDLHDPEVVVFDGNNPTPGLVRAVTSRGRCGLAWVRRGMGGPVASPYLQNARHMDLIIEPGEIAAERDTGPTAIRRAEALQVGPVTLLDHDEILPREDARNALGLSLNAPAVLIQLGAGANRDVAGLTGEIMEYLKRFPQLQIILAEWENSPVELRDWPNAKVLRGFPISRYFEAFDFSISAAGYNTFHEVLAFALPTIFLANRHPSMDDQGARAGFAQDNGAGFDLAEDQLFHLPALCEALMNEKARAFVREKCVLLKQPNGAKAAADAIIELVRTT